MSFGAYLRQGRVLRGLSLDEVATATRLPARVVAALESDETIPLPDRAHALLVARSCAVAIGLDPEETALRLEEQWQEQDPHSAERAPLWKRLWSARPREPLVWVIVALTVCTCAALLLKTH